MSTAFRTVLCTYVRRRNSITNTVPRDLRFDEACGVLCHQHLLKFAAHTIDPYAEMVSLNAPVYGHVNSVVGPN